MSTIRVTRLRERATASWRSPRREQPAVEVPGRSQARPRRRLSRALDVVCAGALLVVTSPLVGAVALVVRVRMGSPVLFRQVRAGQDGVPFVIYKFRTMLDETSSDGTSRSDAERLTPLGELLRTWSLDELPQLVNVLRGDMALVGPRPLYPSYIPLYSAEQARRLLVPPGLTGLAQVYGRNSLSWEEKFALDVRYVDEQSLLLDLRLLVRTARLVLLREGVRTPGHATSPMFTGSPAPAPDPDQERAAG